MPQYALLRNGVFVNGPVLADADWQPQEGLTKVPFDPDVHFKPPIAQTELWVDEFRFLGQLHSPQQQKALNAVHEAAKRMTDAQAKSQSLIARDSNSYPLWALQLIAISFRLMQSLGGRVNLLSTGMVLFFQAAKACGVYGTDEAAADLEIARIMRNETPTAA